MTAQAEISVATLLTAARRAEVVVAMREFYANADGRIAQQPATCWNRGQCCRFGEYGHRLYVTALEVVYYLAMAEANPGNGPLVLEQSEPRGLSPGSSGGEGLQARFREGRVSADDHLRTGLRVPPITEDTCPHAHDGKCHARERRPLGCRIFYCDPAAQHWQSPLTEELLQRLRIMHVELDVPYFYADWISVLRALRAHLSPE